MAINHEHSECALGVNLEAIQLRLFNTPTRKTCKCLKELRTSKLSCVYEFKFLYL
jgi:hypothetical protein